MLKRVLHSLAVVFSLVWLFGCTAESSSIPTEHEESESSTSSYLDEDNPTSPVDDSGEDGSDAGGEDLDTENDTETDSLTIGDSDPANGSDSAPSDNCPLDPDKTEPGVCGCGKPDDDSDGDGTADCLDECPHNPAKTHPGTCGCQPRKPGFSDGSLVPSLGALIWYEAKDICGNGLNVADGTAISTLVDKSGNDNDATLLAGVDSATIETDQGRKVLRLRKGGYRTVFSLGETANTDLEVYFVAKQREISNGTIFHNDGEDLRYAGTICYFATHIMMDFPAPDRVDINWEVNTNEYFAWAMRSSTTQGRSIEQNGTILGSRPNRTTTSPLKHWTIGSTPDARKDLWQADLEAFIVFDKTLSHTQREQLYQFIEEEYDISTNFLDAG